ncbi:MAG: glycosyltransferase family 2 protein [Armatimonadetes bacterium]|nr:glycosyltransferase family 2 protein [Armatimonadota bacterium]
MISVVILTKNEEIDIVDCIRSVSWSDDVHVLDSCSTDKTVELARAAGAHVHLRPFDNYASQRNAGLQLPLKHEWMLFLDADERCTEPLREEICRVVSGDTGQNTAYRMHRHDYFLGRHLKRVMPSPTNIRLLKVGACRYEREVHERLAMDGEIGELQSYFDHFAFSKGVDNWFARHMHYSTHEATAVASDMATSFFGAFARIFKEKEKERRWKAIKQFTYRLPFRRHLKFFFMYVVKGGFMDGLPGLLYCQMLMVYERSVDLKIKYAELEARLRKA